MSIVEKKGKDTIIFASPEDHATPSTIELPEPEPSPGLMLPNGDINWNCPCLGGMATGPCGLEFREAFSCFHYSTAESKGSDCFQVFRDMQACMVQYPSLYGSKVDMDDMEEQDDTSVGKPINDEQAPSANDSQGQESSPIEQVPSESQGHA